MSTHSGQSCSGYGDGEYRLRGIMDPNLESALVPGSGDGAELDDCKESPRRKVSSAWGECRTIGPSEVEVRRHAGAIEHEEGGAAHAEGAGASVVDIEAARRAAVDPGRECTGRIVFARFIICSRGRLVRSERSRIGLAVASELLGGDAA